MPNWAYLAINFLYHLGLAIWIGGVAVLGALVAPALFKALPRQDAGAIFGPILRRFSRWRIAAAGLALASIGFAILTQVGITSGLAPLVTGSIVLSLGMAPVFTLVTNTVLDSTAPERAGAASGMAETSTELGGALGIAILGSIGTAVYRSQLTHAPSAGILGNAVGDTLGGAMARALECTRFTLKACQATIEVLLGVVRNNVSFAWRRC